MDFSDFILGSESTGREFQTGTKVEFRVNTLILNGRDSQSGLRIVECV